jgi:hypothetical protein
MSASKIVISPEAREVAKTRTLKGAWGLKQLLRLLGELAEYDKALEAEIAAAKKRMGLFIALAIVSLIAGIFGAGMFWPLLLFPLVPAGLAIRYGLQMRGLKKADMIDDFRLCLEPVLRQLAQDLDPGEKIKIEMDLSGTTPEKQKSKVNLAPGRFQKLTQTVFEDPWCEARMQLVDGSTVVLSFANSFTKLERRYQTSRGKIKWKTKWKKDCNVSATLTPGSPCAWNEEKIEARLDKTWEKWKYVDKGDVRSARLERAWSYKTPSKPSPAVPQAKIIVGMLLRLHGAMEAGR